MPFSESLQSIGARQVAWLAPALAGFAVLGFALAGVRSATTQVEHSDKVLLRSNDLERKVVDLETGLRGYAITHDHVFLAPMLAAQKGIPAELDELQTLVGGDAAQERRAKAISTAVWSYARTWLQPALQLHESDSALAAQMWASVGRERMQSLRNRFAAFERAERSNRASHASSVSTWQAAVVAITILLLLGAVAAWFLVVRRLSAGVPADVGPVTASEAVDPRDEELLVEIERQRRVDQLTGVANRVGFLERLDEECKSARRHCGDLSLLRLEIQGLAEINKTHGYASGNAVLLRVVGLCNAQLRTGDIVGRIGGDELGILLPRTPAKGAQIVVDALKSKIEAEVATVGPASIPLRVEVGAASAAHGADTETLFESAGTDLVARTAPPASELAA